MCPHGNDADDGESDHYKEFILLPTRNASGYLKLLLKDVIMIKSKKGNICTFFFIHPKSHEPDHLDYPYAIGEVEEELAGFPKLFRVHNQHIINIDQVFYLDKNREVELLDDDCRVQISRDRFCPFKKCLARFGITHFT